MIYSLRCDLNNQFAYVEGDKITSATCPLCGSSHACEPTKLSFMPTVAFQGDELRKHMDWALGQEVTSKSERKRLYTAKGLREKSYSEHRRQHGAPPKSGVGYSYAGQTNNKSTAERRQLG